MFVFQDIRHVVRDIEQSAREILTLLQTVHQCDGIKSGACIYNHISKSFTQIVFMHFLYLSKNNKIMQVENCVSVNPLIEDYQFHILIKNDKHIHVIICYMCVHVLIYQLTYLDCKYFANWHENIVVFFQL